jgi:hypothetical protein
MSTCFTFPKRIAHIHADPVCNAITDSYSYSNANCNPAAYSDTQGAPNTASAP